MEKQHFIIEFLLFVTKIIPIGFLVLLENGHLARTTVGIAALKAALNGAPEEEEKPEANTTPEEQSAADEDQPAQEAEQPAAGTEQPVDDKD